MTVISDDARRLFERVRNDDPTLTEMELQLQFSFGAEGAAALAEALKTNTTLTSINLEYNDLGAEGAKALVETLKTNTTLTSIELGNNNIGPEGAKALAKVLKTNTTLTIIKLNTNMIVDEGVKALAEALKTNTTLTKIDLDNNYISDVGAKALAEALKTNTTLTSIILIGNNYIGVEYGKTIKHLIFRNKVFNHHEAMIKEHPKNFYINTNEDEYEWSSGNKLLSSSEGPVWETDMGDGKVFGLLLDVLRLQFQGDGSEKEKLKFLVETKTNSKGSSLLHLAAGKVIPEALELCKFLVDDIGVDELEDPSDIEKMIKLLPNQCFVNGVKLNLPTGVDPEVAESVFELLLHGARNGTGEKSVAKGMLLVIGSDDNFENIGFCDEGKKSI